MSEVIHLLSMRYFLVSIGSNKRYHHWDSSKCTELNWFHSDPCKPNSIPVPLNYFLNGLLPKCHEKRSKKQFNLQTVSERIEIVGLTSDQGQNRCQKRESHFVMFVQTHRRFMNTICNVPIGLLSKLHLTKQSLYWVGYTTGLLLSSNVTKAIDHF